jgi:hypothetical protein
MTTLSTKLSERTFPAESDDGDPTSSSRKGKLFAESSSAIDSTSLVRGACLLYTVLVDGILFLACDVKATLLLNAVTTERNAREHIKSILVAVVRWETIVVST